jgi:hypothetical protein
METVLFDAAGHPRSPATMPGFRTGIAPRSLLICAVVGLLSAILGLIVGGRGWGEGSLWCARAPSLILVRDPGWLRVGDMMFDGV